MEIVISDLALAAVVYGLAQLGNAYGWGWLFCIYGVPQMIANGWLVLITLLQHTHPGESTVMVCGLLRPVIGCL